MNKKYLWIRSIIYLMVILFAGVITLFAEDDMSLEEILTKSQDDTLEWNQITNDSQSSDSIYDEVTVSFTELPETIDEFVEIRDEMATTPWGGAAVFVMAMIVYSEDPETGMECFTASLVNDAELLRNVTPWGYKGMEPQSYIQDRMTLLQAYPYIADSYLDGAIPENGYETTPANYQCIFLTNSESEINANEYKLWILSSGDDEPREISMEVNNYGIWKMWSWDVMISQVDPPNVARFDEI